MEQPNSQNSFSCAEKQPDGWIQQKVCLATTTIYYRQSKELGFFVQPLNYTYNCPVYRSAAKKAFSLVFLRHVTAPAVIDSATALPADANNTSNSVVLQLRILAHLGCLCTKVIEALGQQHARCKHHLDK